MDTILLAHDGSAAAGRALEFAIQAAKQGGSRLHVLSVVESPRIYGEMAVYVQREPLEQALVDEARKMLAPVDATLANAGIDHVVEVVLGSPHDTIAERAKSLDVKHIVMGSRGLGNFGNLVLGSVANKVLHATTVPVTLVR